MLGRNVEQLGLRIIEVSSALLSGRLTIQRQNCYFDIPFSFEVSLDSITHGGFSWWSQRVQVGNVPQP